MKNVTVTMPYDEFEEIKRKAARIDRLEMLGEIGVIKKATDVESYHDGHVRIVVSIKDLEK